MRKHWCGAAIALCGLAGCAVAYAGPCDDPYNRSSANYSTPACAADRAAWDEEIREWKAGNTPFQRKENWDTAHTICDALHADASDPRTSLCQQLKEHDKAIATTNSEAEKAREVETLRRALNAEAPPQ